MKILVYGAGVIGSYLCHLLIEKGNDVTLLARGEWKENLEKNGLVISHQLQKQETVDHPEIVDALDENERYDAVFAVMQYTQIRQILPDLAKANTPLVRLIGNNAQAEEMDAELQRLCPDSRPKTVLFGLSATGGRRENGKVQCVRLGSLHITCGKLHSEPDAETKALLFRIFGKKNEPDYMRDMNGWLKCHLAFILPICYVSYACGCDLRKAKKRQIQSVMIACGECLKLYRRLGIPVMPKGDEKKLRTGSAPQLYGAASAHHGKDQNRRPCLHRPLPPCRIGDRRAENAYHQLLQDPRCLCGLPQGRLLQKVFCRA